jgi:hypothetical protein
MKKNALVVAAVVAIAILALASYKIYEINTTRSRVMALLKSANETLTPALLAQASANPVDDIEARVAATESHLATLRGLRTSSVGRLADAADETLHSTREILRRHMAIAHARTRLAQSSEALSTHIQSDHGAADWTQQAMRLKNTVDKDSRDYRIAVESYASLLASFPESQAKLAPYVDRALLVDPALLAKARQHALDAHASVEQNVKRISTLKAYRVGDARSR